MLKTKSIIYIGEFDFRNQNVQAHLVKNNGKIFNKLGYQVFYIGMNRKCISMEEIKKLPPIKNYENNYCELPNTLNTVGFFKSGKICKKVIDYLKKLDQKVDIKFIISYQAPTYSYILKKIIRFSRDKKIKYIVNCADLPIFDSQPFLKRYIMKMNWYYMHTLNRKYADGIISVSRYIDNFYKKENRPSIIIPPLFDEKKFNFSWNYSNKKIVFLYAGTPFLILNNKIKISGMKDRLDKIIDFMLELSKKKIDYEFKIIGITKEEYCRCIPRHIKILKGETKIIFLGKKSHEFTIKELSRSDFSINYRDRNIMNQAGFSTKVIESISVGTPVITNRISDVFEYLEEEKTGFELYEDFNKNIEKLIKISSMKKEKIKIYKKQCLNSEMFKIQSFLKPMENFLNNFLENKGKKNEI